MIGRLAAAISLRSRARKFRLFMELVQPTPETTVVDVGVADAPFGEAEGHGATYNFLEAMYPWRDHITAVSVDELPHFAEAFPELRRVQADGRDLPFANDEFDVGFSNAVVEHLGDRDSQEAFVRELCRVSKRVFVSDAEPVVPGRGAHAAAVRALVTRARAEACARQAAARRRRGAAAAQPARVPLALPLSRAHRQHGAVAGCPGA